MCRFGMAEIQQGGGTRHPGAIGETHRTLLWQSPDSVDPLSDVSLLPCDKSPTFIDTV
jgi:hypothetical protein